MTKEESISVLERVAHTESKWPGIEDTLEALDMAIFALRQQEQTPYSKCGYVGKHLDAPPCTTCPAHPKGQSQNEPVTNRNGLSAPLTLDELRKMDGEPVWLNIAGGVWGLVDTSDFVAWLDRGGSVSLDRLSGKVYRQKPKEGTV